MAMTKTYTAGTPVKGGFYLNREDWTMFVAPAEGGVLPGEPGARYAAFPTLVMLVAAPVLSLAFVVFLPFIGIALTVKAGLEYAGVAARTAPAPAPPLVAEAGEHK
jgi:hypothetical protein